MPSLFAFLHNVAAFTLFAALVVELILIKEVLTVGTARRLQIAFRRHSHRDRLLRVFYFEKGAYYYFHTWSFIAKLALFLIVGLVSIVPTL